ncbi:ABC transporter permease subunit [Salinimonas marina]|uniref:ABC transporter permease subunit n=1 Tax=Salinimonas marina TaxID=2785918 RepID=A0A7S9DVB4_9ALTE|nr:ABC transporter permease subunit [Salinimonas marina]QPG04502.1 ABC transporter permease subunit [Salinimonas marina]
MGFSTVLTLARYLFYLILLVPIAVGVIGVILPAAGYFPALGQHGWSSEPFARLLAHPDISKMAGLSLFTSLLATLIAFIGTVAVLAQFYQCKALARIQHGLSPVLAIPHAAAAIAVAFLLAPSGWAARFTATFTHTVLPDAHSLMYDDYGLAIVLALAIKELPFMLLMALGVLSQPNVKQRLEGQMRVAQTLGYCHQTSFLKIVFAQLYPQVRLPVLAVLAYASASVEIPLILGPQNPPTLAVAIVQWFNHTDLSMRFQASAAAIVQMLVTLAAVVVWLLGEKIWQQGFRWQLVSGNRMWGKAGSTWLARLLLGCLVTATLLIMLSMISYSFAGFWPYPNLVPTQLTLLHWQDALQALGKPIGNTLMLGFVSTCIAVLLVLLFLESEQQSNRTGPSATLADKLLFIPLMVPGVAFLYGLVWVGQWLFAEAIWLPVILSHLVYVIPYVFLSLAVAYRQLDIRYVHVATSLGKSPRQVFFRLKLPMLFAPVMVALALGAAISFGQYLPTLLVSGGRLATVTTEAVAIASGASRRLTAVYALMQMLLPLLGFLLAWWLPTMLFNPAKQAKPSGSRNRTC